MMHPAIRRPLVGLQQFQGAIELGEHTAPVDVSHQENGGVHQLCQTHVDDVILLQIDLSGTARALDDEDVILLGEAVVGRQHVGDERLLHLKIVRRPILPPDFSAHNELAAHVAGGL